eukprot:jgi/Phyca11/132811/e_gw1.234.3.1
MFVGRTVSGLPILQPEFAALPPHFATSNDDVRRAKLLCFSGLPASLELVAEFALASLLYHIDFLRQHLESNHPLFQSPLFADSVLVTSLRSIIRCNAEDCEIQPTGVPPHVMILSDIPGVSNLLEQRAYQSGVPTCNNLADSVMKRLEDGGILQLLRSRNDNLPSGTVEQAWVYWCCGDKVKNLPPFRQLRPADLTNRNQRKRLFVDLPQETTNSRKRRRGQLVWVSAATILRKKAKANQVASIR